jgi:hypothetical protein
VTINDKYKIILGAFYHRRYGVSPSAIRGSVKSHAKKHSLIGAAYDRALESAIDRGLIGVTSDSSLTIRAPGRLMLAR